MPEPTGPPAEFDPLSPAVVQEPHALYAALRREAPRYCVPNAAYRLISRDRDVHEAAMNPAVHSSTLVAGMFLRCLSALPIELAP